MTLAQELRPLNILFLEDSADDLALLVRSLRKAGYDPSWAQVEDEDSFKRALQDREWDVVLADYSLPSYDASQAILHLRALRPYVPMIVVSGNVGEETAVSVVKAGAGDYVMKDSLARLAPAIDREIREAKERRLRDNQQSDQDQLALMASNHAPVALIVVSAEGFVGYSNPEARDLLQSLDGEDPTIVASDLLGKDWSTVEQPFPVVLADGSMALGRRRSTSNGHIVVALDRPR